MDGTGKLIYLSLMSHCTIKIEENYIYFFLIFTFRYFILFTNCTLILVYDLYVNKNIVIRDLVILVLVFILLICIFYI